jgi:hypothetical protein
MGVLGNLPLDKALERGFVHLVIFEWGNKGGYRPSYTMKTVGHLYNPARRAHLSAAARSAQRSIPGSGTRASSFSRRVR